MFRTLTIAMLAIMFCSFLFLTACGPDMPVITDVYSAEEYSDEDGGQPGHDVGNDTGESPCVTSDDCDYSDKCMWPPVCENGACVQGGPVDCDDDSSFTDDYCDSSSGCVHVPANCDDDDPCTVQVYQPVDGYCSISYIENCTGPCEEGEEYNICVHSTWEGGECARIEEPYCTPCEDSFYDCQLAFSNGTLKIESYERAWCYGNIRAYELPNQFVCVYGKCERLVKYEDCKESLGLDAYCDGNQYPAECRTYPNSNCNDNVACTKDFFNTGSKQCEYVPDCDDGNPQIEDVCDEETGACVHGTSACNTDVDCIDLAEKYSWCEDDVWHTMGEDAKCLGGMPWGTCVSSYKAQVICPKGCNGPERCMCSSDEDCPTFPPTTCQQYQCK